MYYIPDISEFHIGFRYEETSRSNNEDFVPLTLTEAWELQNIGRHCKIRVKHLDQKDIEELGWVREEEDDRNQHLSFSLKENKQYSLYWNPNDHEVVIQYDMEKGFVNDLSTLFQGKIANFNELQRLMKQTK